MKLRFSLRSLLAVPAIFAVLWAWTTWPHRTFEVFTEAFENGKYELVNSMVDSKDCSFEVSPEQAELKSNETAALIRIQARGFSHFTQYIVRRDRSFLDLLGARSVYVPAYLKPGESGMKFEFVVERGHITLSFR